MVVSTFLRRPAGLMYWLMVKKMVKTNLAITLLPDSAISGCRRFPITLATQPECWTSTKALCSSIASYRLCSSLFYRQWMRSKTCVSQCEIHIHPMRVSAFKREVCILVSECETCVQPLAKPKREVHVYQPKRLVRVPLSERETCVQPLAKPKCEVRVSMPECETCVDEKGLFKHDLCFSTHKCEVHIQPPKAKKSAELESAHPMGSRLVLQIPLQQIWGTTWQRSEVSIKSLLNVAVSDSPR